MAIFFSSTATTFALFMGAFPRQTGIRVRFQSFFLFILLSSTQQLKNIEYVIRVFWMRFMFQLFLQACDLPTPWPQMPPCPLYQVSKTFEPSKYMCNRWSIRQFFLAKSIFFAYRVSLMMVHGILNTGRADHTAAS